MCDHAYEITAIDHGGNAHRHPFTTYECSRCSDVSHHFDNFERAFTETGVQTFGKVGNAEVRIVDARRCRDVLLKLFARADRDLCIAPLEIPAEWYL
jgi:aminoglycoside N3'-acetyltransferase